MLSEKIITQASSYWATHLGCSTRLLFDGPPQVILHGAKLADYDGIFGLFRGGSAIVSIPKGRCGLYQAVLEALPFATSAMDLPDRLCAFSSSVVGPVYIGYADGVRWPATTHQAIPLTKSHAEAARVLQAACTETEWKHGGSAVGDHLASGVFVGEQLVALAGYEIWGNSIAHISVLTHPDFRGCGYGQSAVADIATRALAAGFVPQYHTLESNRPSIRIAKALGFSQYATSIALCLIAQT